MTDSDLSPPDGPLSANSTHIVIQLCRWDIFFVHFLRSSARGLRAHPALETRSPTDSVPIGGSTLRSHTPCNFLAALMKLPRTMLAFANYYVFHYDSLP